MNQKERMMAGLPYKAWMDGLEEERFACRKKIYEFNQLPPEQDSRIPELLKNLLGKTGKNAQIAPNVSIYTAGHPIHPDSRNTGYEYGIPITIGDNVWIGGNAVILPGVTIGNNVIIGAGSVVGKDIPDNMIAAGNPCRVIREITENDRKYYFKDREFDVP